MWIEFSELPENARIWVYPANRKLTEVECDEIAVKAKQFLTQWTAHGAALEASSIIKYNRFLILGLNQDIAAASGCSIDASVRFIQDLERTYTISLLDKMNVTFYSGQYLAHKPLDAFKKMAQNKSVSADTVVFNNLVQTKSELETHWEVPAKASWHSRFFK